MTLTITSLAAGVLALWFVVLSVRVIGQRRNDSVSLGTGDSKTLERRVRAHGNLAEYGPFGLILLGLAEIQAANAVVLGVLALLLVGGRLAHGFALSFSAGNVPFRVGGMFSTFTAIICLALLNLWIVMS